MVNIPLVNYHILPSSSERPLNTQPLASISCLRRWKKSRKLPDSMAIERAAPRAAAVALPPRLPRALHARHQRRRCNPRANSQSKNAVPQVLESFMYV